jgi:hypothetical protein
MQGNTMPILYNLPDVFLFITLYHTDARGVGNRGKEDAGKRVLG